MENEIKNILILSPQKPSNLNGGANLLDNRFKLLSKNWNLFLIAKDHYISNHLYLDYFKRVTLIKKTKPHNLILFFYRYFLVTIFFSYKYIVQNRIKIVQLEFVDTLIYSVFLFPLKLFGVKIFYTAHDIQWLYYSKNTLKFKLVHFIEMFLLKIFVDTVFVWGVDDRDELIKGGLKEKKIRIIPPIIKDLSNNNWKQNDITNFVFMGSCKHRPNLDSIEIILKLWEEIKIIFPMSKLFLITGGHKHLDKHDPTIIYCGFMEDPYEIISQCNFFLAPIVSGTGVKVKIVESFKFGIPVISTPLGFRNFDNLDTNIILMVNEKDFLGRLIDLSKNRVDLQKISEYEKQFFYENFSEKNIHYYDNYYSYT